MLVHFGNLLFTNPLDFSFVGGGTQPQKSYSIQEAKLKSEMDNRMVQAERRKNMMRERIADLRREFQDLLMKNQQVPDHWQVDRGAFEIDPEMTQRIGLMLSPPFSEVVLMVP